MPGSPGFFQSQRERIVRGTITFAREFPASPNGRLYVRLLDVTMADAPARMVSEQVLDLPAGPGPAAFELRAPEIDEHASYIVMAHADLDADGAVSRGDFITTQSYPVLSFGHPDRVQILLKPVE